MQEATLWPAIGGRRDRLLADNRDAPIVPQVNACGPVSANGDVDAETLDQALVSQTIPRVGRASTPAQLANDELLADVISLEEPAVNMAPCRPGRFPRDSRARLSFSQEDGSASESESLGHGRKKRQEGPRGIDQMHDALHPLKKPRKTKEFAWMNSPSDEESGDDGVDGNERVGGAPSRSRSRSRSQSASSSSSNRSLPLSMGDIQSLGEFNRLTRAIKRAVPHMSVPELVKLCQTAARLKYFTCDLFEDIFLQLRVRIRARWLSLYQVTAVAEALVDLNACDAAVFNEVSEYMFLLVDGLTKCQRQKWLCLLESFRHDDGPPRAFFEALHMAPP